MYDSLTSSDEGALRIVNHSCKPGFVPLIQALDPSNAVGRDSLENTFYTRGKYLSRFSLVSERSPLQRFAGVLLSGCQVCGKARCGWQQMLRQH